MMLAFREYLYQQFAHENLSFYLEAANFEYLTDQKEIEVRAKEIFDKFVAPSAPLPINLDFVVTQRLQKALQKPTNLSFKPVTDKIWKVLTNEWFPDFVVSPLYHACNDETIEFIKSDGGRKRSRTLDEYDQLCQNIGHSRNKKKEDAKNL
uniref:RGS domain-containing protein n=1 Tax=Arcella intermedia TaxID=1963864 RepID=A0A6B2LP14_9EUKA